MSFLPSLSSLLKFPINGHEPMTIVWNTTGVPHKKLMGDTGVPWWMRSVPDEVVRVWTLAGTLCFVLGQDNFLSQCFWPPGWWYKWLLVNLMLGVALRWTSIPFGREGVDWGVEILLVASRYRNREKIRSDGPLGSYAVWIRPEKMWSMQGTKYVFTYFG